MTKPPGDALDDVGELTAEDVKAAGLVDADLDDDLDGDDLEDDEDDDLDDEDDYDDEDDLDDDDFDDDDDDDEDDLDEDDEDFDDEDEDDAAEEEPGPDARLGRSAGARAKAHVVRPRSGNRRRRLARLRRRVSGAMVLGITLAAVGIGYAALAPSSAAGEPSDDVRAGQDVYQNNCIACHGRNLQGIPGRAPSLIGVGQAAVYFQVATGRMPLARQEAQAQEKPPLLNAEQTRQVAAYVQSIGGGPVLPTLAAGQTLREGDLAEGGELFRLNCAQCHNFAGQGGALSSGKRAPGLGGASDEIMYAAMLTGPENMPVFGDNQLTPEQKRAIINYVQTLKAQKDPGGHGLGRLGPVPEGIVVWVLGIGVLMFMVMWIGAKS
jgi:ubiquinol-cytochrome c reductase cytochrome c subunit